MFTGIVEEIGKIRRITRGAKSVVLEIGASKVLEGTQIGDSIAVNGICLTVTTKSENMYTADVMPETMRCTNLGALQVGSRVNLERALQLSSRLGGHIVSGHVDGTGRIVGLERDDNAIWITISTTSDIMRYIIYKGSITIDGVSLTVASVEESMFKVSVIPHTQEETTLVGYGEGAVVNLENDIIARYIEKLMQGNGASSEEPKQGGLTFEFLRENGF